MLGTCGEASAVSHIPELEVDRTRRADVRNDANDPKLTPARYL
jgi:hypothetical protein